jgi:hypothetical protein
MTETKAEHKHAYRLSTAVDGCHYFRNVFVCACGDVQVHGGERNFHAVDDPYAAVWMVDDCQRCQELWNGAEPKVEG